MWRVLHGSKNEQRLFTLLQTETKAAQIGSELDINQTHATPEQDHNRKQGLFSKQGPDRWTPLEELRLHLLSKPCHCFHVVPTSLENDRGSVSSSGKCKENREVQSPDDVPRPQSVFLPGFLLSDGSRLWLIPLLFTVSVSMCFWMVRSVMWLILGFI